MNPEPAAIVLASLVALPVDEVLLGIDAAVARRYTSWRVPKGNGNFRTLHAPAVELRRLQRAILERLFYGVPVSPAAHGFVPGRSVVTHARVHADTATALLEIDLEQAYPSVKQPRVRATLEWRLGPWVARQHPTLDKPTRARLWEILTTVVCHDGALPQGAPTSGAVLNLVCGRLDRQCMRLVRAHPEIANLRFSRYADDLAFTASQPIPETFRAEALEAVLRAGFRPNHRKVHLSTAREKAVVLCGIRVHQGKLSLPRATQRRLRALFAQALSFPGNPPVEVKSAIHGAIGYLTMATDVCPRMLERPLREVMAHHAAWLRPPRRRPEGKLATYV